MKFYLILLCEFGACEALHLINIKLSNKSGFIPFLFADIISEAVLKTRSIEPDEAATDTASLAI
jgi:hypothetical protein